MEAQKLNQQIDATFELLKGAYSFLFKVASRKGHWNEVRCTALAAMCLQLREDGSSKWLVAVRDWMLNQQSLEGGATGSWGEEIWDSAMCIVALKELEVSSRHQKVEQGLKWITSLYSVNGRNNWHDEPWETSWALMAILRAGRGLPNIDIASAIRWLISLQSEDGKIIAPHYTAYFLLINYFSRKVNLSDDVRDSLERTSKKCQTYLLESLRNSDPQRLWTGEAWANGQILWALCLSGLFPVTDDGLVEKTIAWFERNQSAEGNWSDIEDTASSMLGLSALLKNLITLEAELSHKIKDVDREIENRLRKAVVVPKLSIKKPLWEREKETGYISVNIKESTARLIIALLTFIFVALLGWVANIIQVLQMFFK